MAQFQVHCVKWWWMLMGEVVAYVDELAAAAQPLV